MVHLDWNRVTTPQGKQGISMLTLPDRQNTGNLAILIFLHGKLWQHRENFENLEFFDNLAIKVAAR